MSNTYQYSSRDGTMILDAVHTVDGLAEGDDVITFEYLSDSVISNIGAGGDVTFNFINDFRARITLKLAGRSASNNFLSILANAQKGGVRRIFPIYFNDGDGNTLHTASKAVIEKIPTSGFGQRLSDVSWTLLTSNLTTIYNNPTSS